MNAFQWLTFSVEPLSVNSLAEAVAVDPTSSPAFSAEDRLVRPYDIVDVLQNLVNVSHASDATDEDDTRVMLVHQSLVEFLQGERLIQEKHAHRWIAQSCLEYISYYTHSGQRMNSKADIAQFPLVLYACKHWTAHTRRWIELRSRETQREPEEESFISRVQRFLSDRLLMKTWLSIFDPENPVNDYFAPWQSETQPLFYAVSTGIPEVVIDFLQKAADVNAGNAYGRRLLHRAVDYGLKDIASVLLAHGADPIAKDREGKTPLLEAASSGHVDLTTLLYQNTDIKTICDIDDSGSTILHSLAMKAPGHIFSTLIEKRHVVDQQIDINHRDMTGCTLLHRAVEAGNLKVITVLLSKGADLNAADEKRDTPLHFAVLYDQEVAKEVLIEQGAVLTIRNAENKSPLELSWAKKSLRWDLYRVDEAQTRSKRISIGAQAECHVLKKEADYPGPDVCLELEFIDNKLILFVR